MGSLRLHLTGCFLLWAGSALAQLDSTTILNEVVIERKRIEELSLGHYSIKVDTDIYVLAASATTADLMQKFGYGHVRSYGPGGLTTLSLRGTGAGHSSILWNGIPLQSPQNGQADMSLIPVFFIDDVQLQMGGSASVNGNGALGGTLHLNSKARFHDGLNIGGFLTGASFSTVVGGISAGWSGKRFSSDTRMFYLDTQNDFPFTNTNVTPAREESRSHAAYNRLGIIHRDYWQPAPNWLVQLEGWLQDNYTQLPSPTSVFRESKSYQRDDFARAMIGAQYTPGPVHISMRSALQRQLLDYLDDVANLSALSNFTSSINSIDATWFISSLLELSSGIHYTYEQSEADDYAVDRAQRNRTALFAAIKLQHKGLLGTVSLREELVDGEAMPFATSLGAEYKLNDKFTFSGNVSRSYRIPTMNDLFWQGVGAAGNKDLQAEHSWSEEVGIHFQSPLANNGEITWRSSAFSSQVDNWILWRYQLFTWTPENIKNVWSRGAESQVTARWKFRGLNTSLRALYSFTRSTNAEVYSSASATEIGKQLPFTPVHEGSVTLKAEWKKWSASLSGNLTGKQYTDDDNSESFSMDPYGTLNAWITRDLGRGNPFKAKVIAEVNNILNSPYESRPGYPMPGLNFRLSINFNIHKAPSK